MVSPAVAAFAEAANTFIDSLASKPEETRSYRPSASVCGDCAVRPARDLTWSSSLASCFSESWAIELTLRIDLSKSTAVLTLTAPSAPIASAPYLAPFASREPSEVEVAFAVAAVPLS